MTKSQKYFYVSKLLIQAVLFASLAGLTCFFAVSFIFWSLELSSQVQETIRAIVLFVFWVYFLGGLIALANKLGVFDDVEEGH